jgi:N-acyl-phosphatidylethanolamine-hydrolysing phospholipase D
MSPQHIDPEQAVQLHLDVKSQKSIAIHWGTFAMGYEVTTVY